EKTLDSTTFKRHSKSSDFGDSLGHTQPGPGNDDKQPVLFNTVTIQYSRGLQPGVRCPLVVRDGIAGGLRHEPMLISSPLILIFFYKFPLIFQHMFRLLL